MSAIFVVVNIFFYGLIRNRDRYPYNLSNKTSKIMHKDEVLCLISIGKFPLERKALPAIDI